jgi:hypothetical protein
VKITWVEGFGKMLKDLGVKNNNMTLFILVVYAEVLFSCGGF